MDKILFGIIFILFFSASGWGQSPVTLESLDKKSRKKFNSAMKCMQEKKYEESELKFREILHKHPDFIEGHKQLAHSYIKQGKKRQAINALIKVDSISKRPTPRVKMKIAELAEEIGDFDLAIFHVKSLLKSNADNDKLQTESSRRLKELEFRMHAYRHPVLFISIPLPPQINTDHHEYLPVFNADNSMLVFCRSEIIDGRRQSEDLYVSYIDSLHHFSEAVPISELNTVMNEGTHSLSPNGKILVFAASDRRDSYGGFDLYISFLKNDKWGKARNMGAAINSRFKDTQPCIAQNNRTIFFSSHRKGGFGGADIWRIDLNDDNTWSEPVNLGPTINTKGNEESPFLHPDNKTLYFRSNGHIGMGDFDIYVSREIKDNEWEQPKNMGYPINTKGSEGALFVSLDGKKAYYATDATTGNNLDIHYFELPASFMPDPVSYLRINVRDAQSGKNLVANIELTQLDSNKKSFLRSDSNGKVLSPVLIGEYAITVEKAGYLFHSEYMHVDSVRHANAPMLFNVYLQSVPDSLKSDPTSSKPIVLNNVFFQSGSDVLLNKSETEINKLYDLLNRESHLKIRIIGHTDNVGSISDNQALSENRARAVYIALTQKGINPDRLEYIGMGESNPIADNNSEEGRQKNRRTEFIIID